jgi:murein L,D-transpeptidase YafK
MLQTQLRILSIRFNTWKRSREIARAYHVSGRLRWPVGLPYPAIVAAVVLLLAAGAVFVLPRAVSGIRVLKHRFASGENHRALSGAVPDTAGKDASATRHDAGALPAAGQSHAVSAPAAGDTVAADDSLRLPDSLLSTAAAKLWTPSAAMRFILFANKANMRLYLLANQRGAWRVGRVYDVVMGRKSGPKAVAGDLRTPEGTYFIIGKREKEELDVVYGPLAYTLNYPNDQDRLAGRTGQGIWIHGTAPDSALAPSRGCIKMANDDLVGLAAILQNGIGTPVVIVNDSTIADPAAQCNFAALKKARQSILQRLWDENLAFAAVIEQWRRAWEAKDIVRFGACYGPDAQSGGVDRQTFLDQKGRTFQMYRTISIGVDSILVSDVSDSVAVVKFVQHYASNVSQMMNAKKLVFRTLEGTWKIYRELTFPKEELFL